MHIVEIHRHTKKHIGRQTDTNLNKYCIVRNKKMSYLLLTVSAVSNTQPTAQKHQQYLLMIINHQLLITDY